MRLEARGWRLEGLRTFNTDSLFRALAFTLALGSAGCTCGERRQADLEPTVDQQREAWLEACIPSPQRFWDDLRGLVGPELREARLPSTLDQLVAYLSGLPLDRVRGTMDWEAPLLFVVYEPPAGRPGREAYALRARRVDTSLHLEGGASSRVVDTGDGSRLYLDVVNDDLLVATSEWALSAARSHASYGCDQTRETIDIRVTKALLGSRQVVSWVERRGAALEASAREATARRGRPTLGDPEVLARMLARWGGDLRSRIEASAPLRIQLKASPETLEATVEGRRTVEGSPQDRPPSESLLGVIAPDAYFAAATVATADERRRHAVDVVGVLAQIAGDRMPQEERQELEAAFSKLASTADGRLAVALRPALEPGPLVGLAAIECDDPRASSEALAEVAGHFGHGSLQNLLEHLGAHVETGDVQTNEQGGDLPFAVTTPPSGDENRGEVPRRLLGTSPTLAWRQQERMLLVAFGGGPENQAELTRLAEAIAQPRASSVLSQPVLAQAIARRPQPELLCYGWLPAMGGLLTQGGPGAGRIPPGGFALSSGDLDAAADRWQASMLLDGEQLRSLIRWFTGRTARS